MGRPKGSKNRPADKGDDFGDNSGELRDGVSDKELHDYIDRIEALNKDQAEISADRQQVFKELKQAGYNRGTVGAIIERRKLTAEERDTADALMDQYMAALGDFAGTPLGEAGAGRVRGEVHIAA
ncbi:MAG: GapR family DNA-binding domain-containing protein [Methylocella sp.]